ncbi:MAG: TIM barrel protein [Chloroflexota bacterium]
MPAAVLLKARPTDRQLADRLRPPLPDGLELYLDTADLATPEAMDGVVSRMHALDLPPGFVLLVEGPIRSLDGEFFDLSRDSEADRELSRRIIDLCRRIGAINANIHMIAPSADPALLTLENRAAVLEQSLAPTRFFAHLATRAGIRPTVENMPPLLRMRESGMYFSCIGMPAADLAWLTSRVEGLGIILDTSHAQLYLNARSGVKDASVSIDLDPLRRFIRAAPGSDSFPGYLHDLGPALAACHVSNATGLLGEGMPYGEGDLDLDALLPNLASRVDHLVIETLEPNHDQAVLMRDAQRRMLRRLGRRPANREDGA